MDYYSGGDKPYLISGADDRLTKIWDYQNKTCVQTLEGHSQNVVCVAFHPELPIILTGSEDGGLFSRMRFFGGARNSIARRDAEDLAREHLPT